MTTRALITADDAKRLATAANEGRCVIEVRRGDVLITFRPGQELDKDEISGVPSTIEEWERRHARKGKRRA